MNDETIECDMQKNPFFLMWLKPAEVIKDGIHMINDPRRKKMIMKPRLGWIFCKQFYNELISGEINISSIEIYDSIEWTMYRATWSSLVKKVIDLDDGYVVFPREAFNRRSLI